MHHECILCYVAHNISKRVPSVIHVAYAPSLDGFITHSNSSLALSLWYQSFSLFGFFRSNAAPLLQPLYCTSAEPHAWWCAAHGKGPCGDQCFPISEHKEHCRKKEKKKRSPFSTLMLTKRAPLACSLRLFLCFCSTPNCRTVMLLSLFFNPFLLLAT